MSEGYAPHAGGRHHGAHGNAAAKTLGRTTGDFLDFSQNINPLGIPESALKAAHLALASDVDTYPDSGYIELRESLARYLDVTADRVLPTNGGAEAIFIAARLAARRSGVKARILAPTFSEYAAAARAAGLEPEHRIYRRPETDFSSDEAALEDLKDVSAVFLCNPNNPTGNALSRDEVLDALERVRAAGAVLVVDEAFVDFVPEISVADVESESLYVARSFTKFFAVPGLRLGALISEHLEEAQTLQPSWSVNAIAVAAGIAAAKERDFTVDSIREVALLRAALVEDLKRLPGIEVYPGSANFLLLRGASRLVGELARAGVLVRGCEPFQGLTDEYFRVAVRSKEHNRQLVDVLRGLL